MLVRLSQSLYLSTQSQLSENKTMELLVRIKMGQFRVHFYPACKTSETLNRLTGNKTMTDSTRLELKNAGYTFKIINPIEA